MGSVAATAPAREPGSRDAHGSSRYSPRLLLGAGGMGRVTLVRDERLRREVAMKTLAPGAAPGLVARLRREALLTAGLEHPGIVAIYDVSPDGEAPWYTMRVVRGRALSALLREAREPRERMRLVRHLLAAAQAVGWAHRHGVIHRDLKPDNLMIGELGETQVVDWGLARRLDEGTPHGDGVPAGSRHESPADNPDDHALTMVGAAVGTPQYMSPEQARGEIADARSDVWSLGLILYEIATGRSGRPSSSAEEALEQARRAEPLVLEDLGSELRAIVSRATARRPEDRYADAAGFADDLASWLDGRRVVAHNYTSRELIFRLIRAWRVPLLVGLIALIALGAAIGLGYRNTLRERDRATGAERRARASEQQARAALGRAEAELSRSLARRAVDLLEARHHAEAADLARDALSHAEEPRARGVLMAVAAEPEPVRLARFGLPRCSSVEVLADLSGFICLEREAISAWGIEDGEPVLRWRRPWEVYWAAPLVGQRRLIVNARGLGHKVLDLAGGDELGSPEICCSALRPTEGGARLFGVAQGSLEVLSRVEVGLERVDGLCEGLLVAGALDDAGRIGAICDDGSVVSGDLEGFERNQLAGADPLAFRYGIGLVPGQARAVMGSNDGRLALVDLARGDRLAEVSGGVGVMGSIAVSPDGGIAAVRDGARGVLLWDLTSGELRGRLPMDLDRGHRFIRGHGRRLATWGRDTLAVWELPRARPSRLRTHGGVAALSVAADTLWVGTGDGLERRDAEGHDLFEAKPAVVKAVVAGRGLVVGHGRFEGGLEMRSAAALEGVVEDEASLHEGFTRHLAPLGELVVRDRDYGPLEVWSRDGERLSLTGDEDSRDLEASAAEDAVVWLTREGDISIVETSLVLTPVLSEPDCRTVAIDTSPGGPEGARFACGAGAEVEVVDREGRLVGWHLAEPGMELGELAWSPDGAVLAGATREGSVLLWVGDEVHPMAILDAHSGQVPALAFDGGRLWSGSWDQSVRAFALAPLSAPRRP